MNDYFLDSGDKYELSRYSKRQLFEVVMKEHFSDPMPSLKSFITKTFKSLPGTTHIGVQIRYGGQWGDGKRYQGDLKSVASCFIAEIIKTCDSSGCPRNCSVFLTTDQSEAIPIFIKALESHGLQTFTTEGDTIHSEKVDGDHKQHLKTFGDWFILSMMTKLVNSRSGFSETASWFGNVPSKALARANTCLFYEEGTEIPDGAEYFSQER